MDVTKWNCKFRGFGVAGQWVIAGDLRDLSREISKWLQRPQVVAREARDSPRSASARGSQKDVPEDKLGICNQAARVLDLRFGSIQNPMFYVSFCRL